MSKTAQTDRKGQNILSFINTDETARAEVKKFFCAIVLMALCSCSSEKAPAISSEAGQKAGGITTGGPGSVVTEEKARYSLKVVPAEATRRTVLTAVSGGFRVQDAKIEWILNGGPVVGLGGKFDTSAATKGDRVQAKALVGDSEVWSETAEIRNSPPELTRVKIMPEVFKTGDSIYVEAVAEDADGDDVSISYEWTKNGEQAGTGKAMELPLKRGDKISVRITPFDGEVHGESALLKREIRNMPPAITEGYKFKIEGRNWSHQMQAADPDGDTLAYSLKAAPEGMAIDPATGLVTWDVPRGFHGKTTVTAAVNDGHGGEATQTFNVYINP
jgi:Bacterial Ig domain